MAILHAVKDIQYLLHDASFEITPIVPKRRGKRDAYKVEIKKDHIITYSHIYSITHWSDGHGIFFSAARVLKNASETYDRFFNIPLYLNDERIKAPCMTGIKSPWLVFTINSSFLTRSSSPNLNQRAEFSCFVFNEQIDSQDELWIRTLIRCPLEDIVKFGTELLEELKFCHAERKRLKIEASFDYINDYSIEDTSI